MKIDRKMRKLSNQRKDFMRQAVGLENIEGQP